jgi:putative ABC transport system ATP-binding protein
MIRLSSSRACSHGRPGVRALNGIADIASGDTCPSWGRPARQVDAAQRVACSTAPTAGAGSAASTCRCRTRQAKVRRKVGFVFQSFHLVPRLTAAENIGCR